MSNSPQLRLGQLGPASIDKNNLAPNNNSVGAPFVEKFSLVEDQVSVTLAKEPAQIIVFINGLLMEDPEDFTLSEDVVSLVNGPSEADRLIAYYWV